MGVPPEPGLSCGLLVPLGAEGLRPARLHADDLPRGPFQCLLRAVGAAPGGQHVGS